jgi:light-regulated signal transduction histidine kinase (bacteriophytochrome)
LKQVMLLDEHKKSEQTLELYAQELESSNDELQQFAYMASHDLQEPLRMVTNYLQLIEKRYIQHLDAQAHEFIGFAVDGASRMSHLISDLLLYSRVGTRKKPFKEIASETVVNKVIANLRFAIEESGAIIVKDFLPVVFADETQLMQLFQNLIGNAIKFRGERPPRIEIAVEKNKNKWLFSLKDNGIGIDPQFGERIFMIFQRLHCRDDYSGTGIGLAICKKIVERHNGEIWLDPGSKNGAHFHFTLPMVTHNP